ncbi:MAG: site-specific integrase [Comamonadaceae bacterium]|nr:site-specific integrase [Comamonadaceae bacterium]
MKTRDPAEAKRRHAEEWEKSEQAFALAQAQLAGADVLSEKDIQQLAARWLRNEVERLERDGEFEQELFPGIQWGYDRPGQPTEWNTEHLTVREAIAQAHEWDWDGIASGHATAVLREHGIPMPTEGSAKHSSLIRAFRVQHERLTEIAAARMGGDWVSQPKLAPHTPLTVGREAGGAPAEQKPEGMSLLSLFDLYATKKRLDDGDNRVTQKTLASYRALMDRFVDLCGNMSVDQISRLTVNAYREQLAKLPSKGEGTRGLRATELIAKADAEGLPRISAATVRNNLRALSAVLSHGLSIGVLTENAVLAGGASKGAAKAASKQAAASRKRRDYNRQELRTIFTSPIYSTAGWTSPRTDFGQAWYWMPLLLYYTGARREELAQLHVADVQREGPHVYLSILETEDGEDGVRSVKTAGSRRRIPLHPDLLDRGFLDYVESVPQAGQLFPKLTANKAGYYGANFGKRWASYLTDVVKLSAPATPAHGFRHTFKTLCREVGIAEDVMDAIAGHAGGNAVGRGYGSMPFARLAQEIVKFPTIASLVLPAPSKPAD